MTTKSRHSWLRCEQCMLKSVMLKCFSSGFSLHVQSEIPGAWPISTKSSLSFLRLLNFATKGQKFSAISTCSIWRSVMLLSSVKLRSLNIGWWWKSLSSRRLVNSGKAIGASAKMLLWIIPIRPSSLRDKSCMFLMSANSWPISSNPVTIFAVKLFSIVDLSLAKSVRSAWPMTSLNPTALRFYLKPFATICNYLKSFETIWNYLQLFETIWNYLQRFEKIWNYLHLFEIIWNDLKPFETICNYLISFETIWNYLQLFEIIWNHLELFESIKNNLEPFEIIWNYLQLFEIIWNHLDLFETIWNHLQLFATIWNHLKPFGTICNYLKPFGTIWKY